MNTVVVVVVFVVVFVVFVVIPRLHQVPITTRSSNKKIHRTLLQNGLCRNLIHSQILIFILFGLQAFNDNAQTIHYFFDAQQPRNFATIDFQNPSGRFSTSTIALVPFHSPVFGVEEIGENGYEWTSSRRSGSGSRSGTSRKGGRFMIGVIPVQMIICERFQFLVCETS